MTQISMKFFTQPKCTKCPNVKNAIHKLKIKKQFTIAEFDSTTDEGMLQSIKHNLMSTPAIVISNGREEVKLVGDISKQDILSTMERLGE